MRTSLTREEIGAIYKTIRAIRRLIDLDEIRLHWLRESLLSLQEWAAALAEVEGKQ